MTVVPQRFVECSSLKNTLTTRDAMQKRYDEQQQTIADSCFPMPITIKFHPKKNISYCSRFRFSCEFGNIFDVILQGNGTFEEHLHKPLYPNPR